MGKDNTIQDLAPFNIASLIAGSMDLRRFAIIFVIIL